ncbi:MAG: hypothetical protein U0V75_02790 [Ferruginibacter sp.]
MLKKSIEVRKPHELKIKRKSARLCACGWLAVNVGGFGLVWDFPTVRPGPLLIFCLVEVKN